MARRAPRLAGLLAAALVACARPAPAAADEGAEAEAEARAHFGRGVELVEQRAWAEALAEFVLSRKLHPTWKATKNAAACLAELGRDDEALDLFEALLREFPELPAQAREEAEAASAKLRERVGLLAVEEGEPGAAVVVDERYRGELPAAASLRVVAGTHVVRVFKDGFEPLEARVVVTGGQRVAVAGRLRALVGAGRLQVVEARGLPVEVIVDGRPVGPAPWEGTVAAGDHVVWLRGAEELGTQPSLVHVAAQAKAAALLAAEPLGARASIAATPADATLAIDGVPVGPGAWEGRLRALAGSLGDSRTGRFQPAGAPAYSIGPVGDAPRAVFVYVEPELRAGLRVSRHVELTAGVAAMVLFDVARPTWDASHEVNASSDGAAFFPAETLTSSVSVAFVPGLAARLEL
jgi:hypothetical protein